MMPRYPTARFRNPRAVEGLADAYISISFHVTPAGQRYAPAGGSGRFICGWQDLAHHSDVSGAGSMCSGIIAAAIHDLNCYHLRNSGEAKSEISEH